MKELFLETVHLNNAYTGNGMYMGFYYATIVFLLFFCKNIIMRMKIAYPSLIMLAFLLIGAPFVNNYLFTLYSDATGGRLFWVLLIVPIIAYGAVCIVHELDSYWRKALLILLMIPIIFLSGVFKFSNALYLPIENEYRLPQNGIDICEVVLESSEEPKLLVPYEIAHIFRQYSTDIKLLYGEDASYGRIWWARKAFVKACNEMDSSSPDVRYISTLAYKEKCDFIIFDNSYHVLDDDPSLHGYDYYQTIDHYDLYKRMD